MIAHWIEQQGISTVVIGLVKLHLEKIQPPRALFVPFEFGRPVGAPDDSDLQLEVLTQALNLIETQTEAGTIVEFDKEDPRATPDPEWIPPAIEAADNIAAEVLALKPNYQRQCVDKSRTAVGVSKLKIADAADLFDTIAAGEAPSITREGISANVMMRLAMDDLKAYYIEAALADGTPSSRQIYDWLWDDTLLGRQIKELRVRFMESNDNKLEKIGTSYCVPHRWR